MIPISTPNLIGNEKIYLTNCIDSTYVSSVGAYVTEFATTVAEMTNAPYGAAVSSGTAGLHVALVAAGVKAGDLVIMPSLTFIATANAVSYCGASPWLIDVESTCWTMDPVKLNETLKKKTILQNGQVIHKSSGKRVAAILPVYMLGTPPNMQPIIETAQKYKIPIICDAAAALGATYRDKAIGALDVLASVFSFNGNKTFTCGGGGAIVSSNKVYMDHVTHLTTTARVGEDYTHDEIGFNYRMTNIQAAVGCAQLEFFDEFIAAKRQCANIYREAFSNRERICGFPQSPSWGKSANWLSGIYLKYDVATIDTFIQKLRHSGIAANRFWKPIHLQQPYSNTPCEDMLVTEQVFQRILPLPCSTHLSIEDQRFVIETIETCLLDLDGV